MRPPGTSPLRRRSYPPRAASRSWTPVLASTSSSGSMQLEGLRRDRELEVLPLHRARSPRRCSRLEARTASPASAAPVETATATPRCEPNSAPPAGSTPAVRSSLSSNSRDPVPGDRQARVRPARSSTERIPSGLPAGTTMPCWRRHRCTRPAGSPPITRRTKGSLAAPVRCIPQVDRRGVDRSAGQLGKPGNAAGALRRPLDGGADRAHQQVEAGVVTPGQTHRAGCTAERQRPGESVLGHHGGGARWPGDQARLAQDGSGRGPPYLSRTSSPRRGRGRWAPGRPGPSAPATIRAASLAATACGSCVICVMYTDYSFYWILAPDSSVPYPPSATIESWNSGDDEELPQRREQRVVEGRRVEHQVVRLLERRARSRGRTRERRPGCPCRRRHVRTRRPPRRRGGCSPRVGSRPSAAGSTARAGQLVVEQHPGAATGWRLTYRTAGARARSRDAGQAEWVALEHTSRPCCRCTSRITAPGAHGAPGPGRAGAACTRRSPGRSRCEPARWQRPSRRATRPPREPTFEDTRSQPTGPARREGRRPPGREPGRASRWRRRCGPPRPGRAAARPRRPRRRGGPPGRPGTPSSPSARTSEVRTPAPRGSGVATTRPPRGPAGPSPSRPCPSSGGELAGQPGRGPGQSAPARRPRASASRGAAKMSKVRAADTG